MGRDVRPGRRRFSADQSPLRCLEFSHTATLPRPTPRPTALPLGWELHPGKRFGIVPMSGFSKGLNLLLREWGLGPSYFSAES